MFFSFHICRGLPLKSGFTFLTLLTMASSLLAGQAEQSAAHLLAMPMSFEANQGQTDPAVRFLSRGPGYSLFRTPSEAVLSLRSSQPAKATRGQVSAHRKSEQA